MKKYNMADYTVLVLCVVFLVICGYLFTLTGNVMLAILMAGLLGFVIVVGHDMWTDHIDNKPKKTCFCEDWDFLEIEEGSDEAKACPSSRHCFKRR